MSAPESYLASRRYENAALQYERAEEPVECAVQRRDVQVIFDVYRYKFLSAPQLHELWWSGSSVQASSRRLRKLFQAGYLDRFRPLAYRGSYPWTFQISADGHRLLQRAGLVDHRHRFARRGVYDYSYVAHDLQLNAWVLAYRRGAGESFVTWEGETEITPPHDLRRGQLRLADNWSAEGLRDDKPRPLRPDAILELDIGEEVTKTIFVEYDRTRRVDKNFEKFRRYDSFLTWWSQHHPDYLDRTELPFVLFICQSADQRDEFVYAADRHLSGHRWKPGTNTTNQPYLGRRHVVFADEIDAHNDLHQAVRLPTYPPGHKLRKDELTRIWLPGSDQLTRLQSAT